jgi:hypothetical protein
MKTTDFLCNFFKISLNYTHNIVRKHSIIQCPAGKEQGGYSTFQQIKKGDILFLTDAGLIVDIARAESDIYLSDMNFHDDENPFLEDFIWRTLEVRFLKKDAFITYDEIHKYLFSRTMLSQNFCAKLYPKDRDGFKGCIKTHMQTSGKSTKSGPVSAGAIQENNTLPDLLGLDVLSLLKLSSSVIDELKRREILKTNNNPVGDYAEWLCKKSFNLTLETNSNAGFDATDSDGVKYEVKARKVTPDNGSRQLSVIRNYENKNFDFLIGIILNDDFTVKEAYKIPHETVGKYATFREHQNGHILILKGEVLEDSEVIDVTNEISM